MIIERKLLIGALFALAFSLLSLGAYLVVQLIRTGEADEKGKSFYKKEVPVWFDRDEDLRVLEEQGVFPWYDGVL